jgi:methionyl-tRNA formyltransferase
MENRQDINMDVCISTSLEPGNVLLDLCIAECSKLNGNIQVEYDTLPSNDFINENTLYLSFLGDTIIPEHLINQHTYNTHPGPPHYRGWGARLRTILDNQQQHGVTLHRVVKRVDAGDILHTSWFDVDKNDTPDTIHATAEIHCLKLVSWLIKQYQQNIVPNYKVAEWSGTFMYKKEFFEQLKKYNLNRDICEKI